MPVVRGFLGGGGCKGGGEQQQAAGKNKKDIGLHLTFHFV